MAPRENLSALYDQLGYRVGLMSYPDPNAPGLDVVISGRLSPDDIAACERNHGTVDITREAVNREASDAGAV